MSEITSKEIQQVMKSLKTNGFAAEFVATAEAATRRALELIPLDAKVGYGGSTTIRQLDLIPELEKRGTTVLNKTIGSAGLPVAERDRRINRTSTVYLSSSNAVTLDGKLVNIDGTGNRVVGMTFGPESVLLIVGANKIVRNVSEAIDRIKKVITPFNNRDRGRKVPCAVTLRCSDCKSPDRGCRITVILEKKPRNTNIAILLVGEDVGLGWDPAWPQERIDKIQSTHTRTWQSPRQQQSLHPELFIDVKPSQP